MFYGIYTSKNGCSKVLKEEKSMFFAVNRLLKYAAHHTENQYNIK